MALYGDERLLTIYRDLDLENHAICLDTVGLDAECSTRSKDLFSMRTNNAAIYGRA